MQGESELNMKSIVTILFCLLFGVLKAQTTEEDKLTATIKGFHTALEKGNTVSINQQTDKALSYGHSNGWVETKTTMLDNLKTGYLKYNSFAMDSLSFSINGNMANARFVADINVTMKGTAATYHLKVLEVWVKKSNRWVLFARQAVK